MYHKPNCSTSLGALKMLKEKGIKPELRLYLENPPTQKELSELLKKLGYRKALQLVRTKEKLYQEQYKDKKLLKQDWLRILSQNPILIERPILIKGDKAILGRPPEEFLKLL